LITILVTGGTISKSYDEISGELIFDEDSIKKMLSQSRVDGIEIEYLFFKDSLDLSDSDRELIVKKVLHLKSDKIIITHGTDTMSKSAKKLSSIKNKTIILTGAMIPFAFKNSDALFNLGTAFGGISTLKEGVYIAMNGTIFSWDSVKKDKKMGRFVTKS